MGEDRVRVGITGIFVVPGENKNEKRVMEFCAERGLFVGNTYFDHKSLHNYTWVARVQNEVGVKSRIDLMLVKDMLRFVQDVLAVRGMGQGLSDHHAAMCNVRLVGAWIKRRIIVDGARKISSEKLR